MFLFEKYISKNSLKEMSIDKLLNQLLVPCLDILRMVYLESLLKNHEQEELLKFEMVNEH